MDSETPARPTALQTNRPWLSVAGCLGGTAITAVVVVLLVVALVIWFVFPEWVPFRASGE